MTRLWLACVVLVLTVILLIVMMHNYRSAIPNLRPIQGQLFISNLHLHNSKQPKLTYQPQVNESKLSHHTNPSHQLPEQTDRIKKNYTWVHQLVFHREYRHSQPSLYTTLMQPNSTCSNKTFLIVGVISKPSNQQHRRVYRNTVLSPITNQCLPDLKYVFVVGRPDSQELQERLNQESLEFGDIIQGNFTDSYDNLTIKSMYLVQWAKTNCPAAHFLLKIDDDVFTILDDVTSYLKFESLANYSVSGSIFTKVKPIRDSRNKWHVDSKSYPNPEYPTYVSGTAYILSYSLLEPIFTAGVGLPFIRLEDVFITGIAAKASGLPVQHYQVPGFHYTHSTPGLNLARVDFHSTKSIHGVDDKQLTFLYDRLKKERADECL